MQPCDWSPTMKFGACVSQYVLVNQASASELIFKVIMSMEYMEEIS